MQRSLRRRRGAGDRAAPHRFPSLPPRPSPPAPLVSHTPSPLCPSCSVPPPLTVPLAFYHPPVFTPPGGSELRRAGTIARAPPTGPHPRLSPVGAHSLQLATHHATAAHAAGHGRQGGGRFGKGGRHVAKGGARRGLAARRAGSLAGGQVQDHCHHSAAACIEQKERSHA